jgi:undecaprenyl-diphosphatase
MVLLFIFGGMSGRKTAIMMLLIMIILVPSVLAIKEIVERPRPFDVPTAEYLIIPEGKYSYPSGHATIVSAGAATLLVLFRDSPRRLGVAIGLAVEAALVCISVVYVGVHYPLDVVGGILFGTGVSFIFIGFTKRFEKTILSMTRIFRR